METLSSQVAGHMNNDKSLSMMKFDGNVLKPIIKPIFGKREITFYEELENSDDPIVQELKQLVPKYYGTRNIKINENEVQYIVLEDLTKNYQEPCVMDIKIGRRTWDPLATTEKITNEDKKYAASKRDVAFSIPGFQVYNLNDNSLHRYDKKYGKQLNGHSIINALRIFLNADTNFCKQLVTNFLVDLWKIHDWVKKQRKFRIYSSSLLLVYDAARLREQILNEEPKTVNLGNQSCNASKREINETWSLVKMIDFAHVFPSEDNNIDTNYLEGVNNLVKIFENFLDESN